MLKGFAMTDLSLSVSNVVLYFKNAPNLHHLTKASLLASPPWKSEMMVIFLKFLFSFCWNGDHDDLRLFLADPHSGKSPYENPEFNTKLSCWKHRVYFILLYLLLKQIQLGEKRIQQTALLWSKTNTLSTSIEGGAWVDPLDKRIM